MGSPAGEAGRRGNEGPVRTVNISQRIAMGRYEVTFADYDRFVAATSGRRPNDSGWGRGRRPVIYVGQEDAKAYATWLSAQTGQRYRLPSESEWEYAARAGTSTRYSWGDEIGVNRANCDGCGSEWDDEQTAPVGRFAANAFGLFDMHGNVWEWVEDCYVDSYAGAPIDGSARRSGCGSDVRAVLRGGSWFNQWSAESAFRLPQQEQAAEDARSRPAQARLQGCRAFGELSGSAELTEDRAVIERRLEQAADAYRDVGGRAASGTGGRGIQWFIAYILAQRE